MKTIAFAFALALLISYVLGIIPPKSPPEELLPGYTLNGSIPIEYFYVDDTNKGEATHFTFSKTEIEQYIQSSKKVIQRFQQLQQQIFGLPADSSLPLQAASIIIQRLPKQQWVQFALFVCKHQFIEDKIIGVIGSMEPWIESFLLALGAAKVVTIEYNSLTYMHPQLETINKNQFEDLYRKCKFTNNLEIGTNNCYEEYFDFIVSPSAFDHDGLGRYGDPLSPNGDLLAMQRMKHLLKSNHTGVLLLSVPIGPDVTVFNLHRRYGATRLPLLLQGWEEVARLGWEEYKLRDEQKDNSDWKKTYEPFFLLTYSELNNIHQDSSLNERENSLGIEL